MKAWTDIIILIVGIEMFIILQIFIFGLVFFAWEKIKDELTGGE